MVDFFSTSTYPEKEIKFSSEKTEEAKGVALTPITPHSPQSLYQFVSNEILSKAEPEEAQMFADMSKNDPERFQKEIILEASYYIREVIENVNDEALKGNLPGAYMELVYLADFSDNEIQTIALGQTPGTPVNISGFHLRQKFAGFNEILDEIGFLENMEELYDKEGISNPHQLRDNLISYSDILSNDHKARLNIRCASLFMPRDTEQLKVTNLSNSEYKQHLHKALETAEQFNTVANCQLYFGEKISSEDTRALKDAYKRVLSISEKEKDYLSVFNASKKLRNIYEEAQQAVGYRKDNTAAEKAIKYQKIAMKAERKINNGENSLTELKVLSKVIEKGGDPKEWIDVQKQIAAKLKGVDKYNALMKIMPKMSNGHVQFANRISKNLLDERSMSKKDKNYVLDELNKTSKLYIKDKNARAKAEALVEKSKTIVNAPKTRNLVKADNSR